MSDFRTKSAFSYEDLLSCGHGKLFGPGNARLPLPPMLMFDRIVHISETGGAHGKGLVYEKGRVTGEADLTQASVGFLAGGQTFRELIVFGTPQALDNFRNGQMSLGADINAVALKTGAAASTQFKNGLAVFTKPTGGAMFEASVAGQKFSYKPM